MNFQESIIIPLELYKLYKKNSTLDDKSVDILMDTSLPDDTKLKLLSQARNLGSFQRDSRKDILAKDDSEDFSYLLTNFPSEDRSVVKEILDKFKKHSSELSWSKKDQSVTVDGENVIGSNIVRILQYLRDNLPAASGTPYGTEEVYRKLTKLKIPKSWIKRKPGNNSVRRPPRSPPVVRSRTPRSPPVVTSPVIQISPSPTYPPASLAYTPVRSPRIQTSPPSASAIDVGHTLRLASPPIAARRPKRYKQKQASDYYTPPARPKWDFY